MTRLVLVVAVAALGAGCAGTRSASHPAPAPAQAQASGTSPGTGSHGMSPEMTARCPMAVPGTQVTAADTPDGVAVTFTTSSPEAVPDLRARIHAMADRYERRHASGQAMQDGPPSGDREAGSAGSGSPGGQQMPAPSRAVVEDVDGGSRVTITPNDPSELETLRAHVMQRVAHMQETGSCDMGNGHADRGNQAPEQGVPSPQR